MMGVSRLITPGTLTGAKVPPNPRVWSGWLPIGLVLRVCDDTASRREADMSATDHDWTKPPALSIPEVGAHAEAHR